MTSSPPLVQMKQSIHHITINPNQKRLSHKKYTKALVPTDKINLDKKTGIGIASKISKIKIPTGEIRLPNALPTTPPIKQPRSVHRINDIIILYKKITCAMDTRTLLY